MTSRLDELPGRRCSIAGALDVVGDRWALLVVREVALGAHRFSEIRRGTGAPREQLTARLNALVDAGVLERKQYSESPPRWDYHLTKAGRDLWPVLQALMQWGDRYVADDPPVELRHAGHRITASWVCDVCGERIGRDTERHVRERHEPAEGPLPG
ncbi:transcriptional regulator, HxlR family [Blastococcus fimeti]|nr:transcriptional regulator, HxlR family [Blastococcus fimeti]